MKFIINIIKNNEYRAKREALYQPRGMTDRMLIDCNISFGLQIQGSSIDERREVARATLERVGLAGV